MQTSNSTALAPPNSAQAQVSSQSAFWGLVSLAINSMCQPAGKICDGPRSIGPLMRVSPIVCFIDMVSILFRLAVYSIRKRSFPEACKLVMIQRYNHEPALSALSEFRYNALLRWITFLASLSQMVKLFAFQGLVWTKVWAAMYLGSFLTNEVLVLVSKPWLPDQWPTNLPAVPHPDGSGYKSLPYISSALGTVFFLFFLISAAASAFNHQGKSFNTLDCTGVVILACSSAAFLPSWYYLYRAWHGPTQASMARILLAVVMLVPAIYILALVQHKTDLVAPSVANVLVPGLIAIWTLLAFSWASATFPRANLSWDVKRRLEISLASYFFVMNLVAALLYYRFGYDPAGTVKPAWTENLG